MEEVQVEIFIDYLRNEKAFSVHTIEAYTKDLREFIEFAQFFYPSFFVPTEHDRDVVRAWLSSLIDRGLKPATVERKLSTLKSFYKFLCRRGDLDASPLKGIRAPKKEHPLPSYLTTGQLEYLFDSLPTEATFENIRNRLILEIIYQTGLRRSEVAGLLDKDVDLGQLQLKVKGKGGKQRIIPFGEDLKKRIEGYRLFRMQEVGDSQFFFVTLSKQPLKGGDVYTIVHRALSVIDGLPRRGAHVLRHSFATEMLNCGADLTSIKELLGHRSLETTVKYTHTSFGQLKQLYNAHPRAKKNDAMKVIIQSVHFDATAQLEEFVQKKMDRLAKLLEVASQAEVTLKLSRSGEDKNKVASIRLEVPGNDLFAEKNAATFEEAVDLASDALKKQIERIKEQHR